MLLHFGFSFLSTYIGMSFIKKEVLHRLLGIWKGYDLTFDESCRIETAYLLMPPRKGSGVKCGRLEIHSESGQRVACLLQKHEYSQRSSSLRIYSRALGMNQRFSLGFRILTHFGV